MFRSQNKLNISQKPYFTASAPLKRLKLCLDPTRLASGSVYSTHNSASQIKRVGSFHSMVTDRDRQAQQTWADPLFCLDLAKCTIKRNALNYIYFKLLLLFLVLVNNHTTDVPLPYIWWEHRVPPTPRSTQFFDDCLQNQLGFMGQRAGWRPFPPLWCDYFVLLSDVVTCTFLLSISMVSWQNNMCSRASLLTTPFHLDWEIGSETN